VRRALALLHGDAATAGSPTVNALDSLVRLGDIVVVKRKFVREIREGAADDGDCVFTYGAVIRAVLDVVAAALRGHGRLVVADAPQNESDFDVIAAWTNVAAASDEVQGRHGLRVEVIDLRSEAAFKKNGVILGHRPPRPSRIPGVIGSEEVRLTEPPGDNQVMCGIARFVGSGTEARLREMCGTFLSRTELTKVRDALGRALSVDHVSRLGRNTSTSYSLPSATRRWDKIFKLSK